MLNSRPAGRAHIPRARFPFCVVSSLEFPRAASREFLSSFSRPYTRIILFVYFRLDILQMPRALLEPPGEAIIEGSRMQGRGIESRRWICATARTFECSIPWRRNYHRAHVGRRSLCMCVCVDLSFSLFARCRCSARRKFRARRCHAFMRGARVWE